MKAVEMNRRCPCGGIILADTEEWDTPLCYECYRFGGLETEFERMGQLLEAYKQLENIVEAYRFSWSNESIDMEVAFNTALSAVRAAKEVKS